MKRILSLLLTSLPFVASAFDFSAVNEDGKTIYYNVLSRTECQVVSGTSNYSGDVRIPATVSYGGNEMSVTSIGIYAFWYCTSLRSVEIPSSLTKIEESAFYGSKNLDKAEFASIGHLCSIDFSDFSSNPLSYANHLYIDGEEIFDVVIPDNVTKLSSTFSGCSYLTSVVMPSGLSNIGDYSFYECSSLTSIEIPGSVNSIGDAAFRECSSLASIDIPSSVTSIGKYAFYGCSSLIEEKIPNGVISIGLGAFQDCSKLASIEIPYSVNSIGSDAFAGCSSLTKADFTSIEHLCSIEFNGYYSNPLYSAHHLYISGDEITDLRIPSSVTVIPENVFYGCNFLTSLEIDRGVTHIGNRSFYNCSSLTSVVIPSSVTSVGNWAFSGCSSLNEVKVFAETPPSATEPTTIFGNVTKTFGTLYVPRNCKVAYETAKGWKDFIDIIEETINSDDSEIPEPMVCAKPVLTYENGELHFSCDTEGATYHYNIQLSLELSGESTGVAKLPDSYTILITAYATAEGYEPSEKAITTFTISVCDVNGDGEVNIGDVTTLVNKILTLN